MIFISLLLCSFAVATCHGASKNPCDGYRNVTCPCGQSGNVVVVPVKMCYVKSVVTGERVCKPCDREYHPDKICQQFHNCETCISGSGKCNTCPPGITGDFCMIEYHGRVKRQTGRGDSCSVPNCLSTVKLNCTQYTHEITCEGQCAYGYTYPKGIYGHFYCFYNDDIWRPHKIQQCKPYVNCMIEITSGGHMNCTRFGDNKGNVCTIHCFPFGGYPEVSSSDHSCDLHGNWNPELPWCAKRQPNIFTVAPPPNVIHHG